MTWFFWIMSAITVVFSLASHYTLSRGWLRYTYPLNIVVYLSYIIVETALALTNPAQLGVLLYNIINVLALYWAIKGMLRLRKLHDERTDTSTDSKSD